MLAKSKLLRGGLYRGLDKAVLRGSLRGVLEVQTIAHMGIICGLHSSIFLNNNKKNSRV